MELGQGTKEEGGRRRSSGDQDKRLHDDGGGDDDEGTRQPYNCTFCKRGFPTAQALGGHMNVHRKDRGRAASTAPTVVAAERGACGYEPATTLVDAFTGYVQKAHPVSGAGGSSLHAERAPQELRLFGHDGAAGGGEEGGDRDRREYDDGKDGNNDDDHGEQGEELLDLELRLGAAGQ